MQEQHPDGGKDVLRHAYLIQDYIVEYEPHEKQDKLSNPRPKAHACEHRDHCHS